MHKVPRMLLSFVALFTYGMDLENPTVPLLRPSQLQKQFDAHNERIRAVQARYPAEQENGATQVVLASTCCLTVGAVIGAYLYFKNYQG